MESIRACAQKMSICNCQTKYAAHEQHKNINRTAHNDKKNARATDAFRHPRVAYTFRANLPFMCCGAACSWYSLTKYNSQHPYGFIWVRNFHFPIFVFFFFALAEQSSAINQCVWYSTYIYILKFLFIYCVIYWQASRRRCLRCSRVQCELSLFFNKDLSICNICSCSTIFIKVFNFARKFKFF